MSDLIRRSILAGPTVDPGHHLAGLEKLQTVIGYVAWSMGFACLIGLLFVGVKMVFEFKGGSAQHFGSLGKVIGGCVLVGSASTLAGSILGFDLFTANAQAIPGLTMVQTIVNTVAWISFGMCVVGIMACGGMMAMSHRRGENPAEHVGSVMAGCLIVGSATSLVGAFI